MLESGGGSPWKAAGAPEGHRKTTKRLEPASGAHDGRDGDASYPEGLIRLLFGRGVEGEPRPLVELFGGVETVTCPVDDSSSLKRLADGRPVPEHRIDVSREIPSEYYLRKGGTTLFQTGEIAHYGRGCDGPLEKVVRDFVVQGDAVHLIDMKAGVEHFGRRIPDRMDLIIGVLDATLESVSIARRIADFCAEAGSAEFCFLLDEIASKQIEGMLVEKLGALARRVVGCIAFEEELAEAGLSGEPLGECPALPEVDRAVQEMERIADQPHALPPA